MKTVFFIVGVFLFINLKTQAQSAHFGLKAGLNVSAIKISDGNDFDSKAGFYGGGLVHIHINKHFAVQPELVYSMQGGKKGTLTRSLNYINLPVLLQYMTADGFRLQTGPQIGFMVSGKDKVGNVEVKINDQLNTTDFSWSFGASYITKSSWGIDARYNLGITNMNESESVPEGRNRVFQIGLFYQMHDHQHH